MLILYAVVAGIVIGYTRGGRISALLQKPFKLNLLVFAAIIIQLILFSENPLVNGISNGMFVIFHLISYVLIIAFVIFNIKLYGIGIIGAGILLNFIAIFLNKGYMPTSPEYFKGVQQNSEILNNTVKAGNETILPWLGDIFHTPLWLPLSNAFSIGDALIAIGTFIYLVIYMKPSVQWRKES